jgi:hypothetical protein
MNRSLCKTSRICCRSSDLRARSQVDSAVPVGPAGAESWPARSGPQVDSTVSVEVADAWSSPTGAGLQVDSVVSLATTGG